MTQNRNLTLKTNQYNNKARRWSDHSDNKPTTTILLKFRHYEKATKFEKISHLFWQDSCFYSIASKQVRDFFEFLWPFQKSWILFTFFRFCHQTATNSVFFLCDIAGFTNGRKVQKTISDTEGTRNCVIDQGMETIGQCRQGYHPIFQNLHCVSHFFLFR